MEIIMSFLMKTAIIVAYLLVFIFLGGFVIEYMERKSNQNIMRAVGYTGIVLTGLGTVIHELSHLIMGILGGMKPVEVKLFRPIEGRKDGKLGYVINSYNKKNYYQRMFLVLVGIAPIIGGTLVMVLMLKLCLPNVFDVMTAYMRDIKTANGIINLDFISSIISLMGNVLKGIFDFKNFSNTGFWIFMYVVLSVASHMSLSGADIKGCLGGIPALYVLVLLINLIVTTLGFELNIVIQFITLINAYIIMFLSIAILFSFINWMITFILINIVKVIKQ